MKEFNFIILAGGKSTRMGSPKHLLPFADGLPLYSHIAQILRAASPTLSTLYVSLAGYSILDNSLQHGELSVKTEEGPAQIHLCRIFDEAEREIGPAAGLIAAHHHDPNATWIVVACDFPFVRVETVHQLMGEHEDPITCFANADGFNEPFLAVWSPEALMVLEQNVARGILSPNRTIRQLAGKRIAPRCEWWIENVNTSEEWDRARTCMDIAYSGTFSE